MRIKICDINIDVLTIQETIDKVQEYAVQEKPLHLMGVNSDKINLCLSDPTIKKIVNNCEVINADGASVVLASKFLKKPLPERVAGIDLMMDLVELAAKDDYPIFLLGAKEEVVNKTAFVLKEKYSSLNICGIRNGYFEYEEWRGISQLIQESGARIVFVGITSPKKELLIDYLQQKGSKAIFMGVGGSFDVISGNLKRAPLFLQKMNLEWLYRVMQEPRRLFKRYFIGNWRFILQVIRYRNLNR